MTESFNRKLGRLAQSVSGTGSITSNAATASTWETARTLTLGGDLSGNVSIDGSQNVTLTATVSGNTVALGTDTTGDYVATVTAGTGITTTGTGEGAAVTVSIDSTVATLTGSQTLTNKTLTTPVISSVSSPSSITLDATQDIILDADGADIILKDNDVTYGALTQVAGELAIKSGATPTTALTFSGSNVTVVGNLIVSGTTTTVNSTEVNIADNIITLNSDETGTPSQNAGIEIERGTSTNVSLLWDEANDTWTIGTEKIQAGTFDGININITGNFYQNGNLVTLTSQDYGLITGVVNNSADYGSIV